MFKHDKALLKDVKVDGPNPNYAAMMQEQLGGPHGELKAALQYLSQSMRIKDPEIKDLFAVLKIVALLKTPNCTSTCQIRADNIFNAENAKPTSFSNPN